MKTILLLATTLFTVASTNAQFSQNFEGTEADLTNNCWVLNGIYATNAAGDVISGNGSMFTNPPVNGSSTRDIMSPALNVTSTLFTVSFKYKVSSRINGNATRTIEVGLMTGSGAFTSLQTIVMNNNSPTTVQTFNQTFVLTSTGLRRLVLKLGGATGDGNSRLIFDDLYASASPRYGNGTCNSAPIAVNDAFIGIIGSVVTGNILANDNEPNGETMVPAIVNNASNGVLVLNPAGNFVFTPNNGFAGVVTFSYNLNDNGIDPLVSNTATVTINYVTAASLPVKLISFSAFLNNNRVEIKWATSEEVNVSHYVIEKSTDGRNFSDAGTVFAMGNTSARTNYSFNDNPGVSSGILYYRLRSVDVDGKTQYSEIRTIRLDRKAETTVTILTFPNPVVNELKVTIPANWQNKRVVYELFMLNGQSAKKTENASSSQTETINVSNLQPGMYLVRVSCEGQAAQQKIIKH